LITIKTAFAIIGRQRVLRPKTTRAPVIKAPSTVRNIRDRPNARRNQIVVSKSVKEIETVVRKTASLIPIAAKKIRKKQILTKNNLSCSSQNIPIFRVYFDFFSSTLNLDD